MKKILLLSLCSTVWSLADGQERCSYSTPETFTVLMESFEEDSISGHADIQVKLIVNVGNNTERGVR